MALSTLIPIIKETTGRWDLLQATEDDLTPVGYFYLNAAQRFLDRLALFDKMRAKHTAKIAEDEYYKTFTYARAVESIWIADPVGEIELDMDTYSYNALREKYSAVPANLGTGQPKYAALDVIRVAPGSETLDNNYKTADLNTDQAVRGIIFYPPADGDYEMTIEGLFYSPPFTATTSTSFWSETAPDLLIEALSYKLEVFQRNAEGRRDWLEALRLEALQVAADYTREGLSTTPLQMNG